MRVLWISNIVPNKFSECFQIKKRPYGGWVESLADELIANDNIEIGFCVPIYDEERIKNFSFLKHRVYSFHGAMDLKNYDFSMKQEFKNIFMDYKPDVIHIWGTEYNHSRAAVEACCDTGQIDKVLVRIQGLTSIHSHHYTLGIPYTYLTKRFNGKSILDEKKSMELCGQNEIQLFKLVNHVCDRSEWGEFCVKQINSRINFYYFDNILRPNFYCSNKWDINQCRKYSIFVSQASYPIKGFHFLLKAAYILKDKYPDLSIRISGDNIISPDNPLYDGGYSNYIRDLIKQYSLENIVQYLGQLNEEEMVKEYLSAHISVCPSTIENRANSICEAMMLGTPTIASNVGGNIETITNGIDGYMYPVDEFYMLAGYIDRIFSDEKLAEKISKAAVETAVKRHDKKMIADKMIRIYEDIGLYKSSDYH